MDLLQRKATQVRDKLVRDRESRADVLRKGELDAEAKHPGLTYANNGKAVERAVAGDETVKKYFRHTGPRGGPDFVAKNTSLGYEVTSSRLATVKRHLARAYVDKERLTTYDMWRC